MKRTKTITATVMLAGLAAPVLAGCGDGGPLGPSPAAATTSAATAAARVYVDDWQRVIASCGSAGQGYHRSTDSQACQDSDQAARENPCAQPSYLSDGRDRDVESCASKLLTRAERGTPIPTPTATPTPAQQASGDDSGGHGISSALVGFVQLALGAACVLGLPALVIWGAIAGRRRAHAVHRQGAEWQQSASAPMYDARRDHDAFDEPAAPDINPWA